MPLVDITNDIKRSRLKQQHLGEEKEEKKSSSLLKPIPSTLRRISISKKSSSKEDGKEGEEEEAVSYTHLRAHETREDLVCRLLLEKKK